MASYTGHSVLIAGQLLEQDQGTSMYLGSKGRMVRHEYNPVSATPILSNIIRALMVQRTRLGGKQSSGGHIVKLEKYNFLYLPLRLSPRASPDEISFIYELNLGNAVRVFKALLQ